MPSIIVHLFLQLVYSNIYDSFQEKDCSAHVASSIIIYSCCEAKYPLTSYLVQGKISSTFPLYKI